MSGLRNSRVFDDAQIADLLTDGLGELGDIFIQSYQHWFQRKYTFTLAGGAGGNAVDLATALPDFQMAQLLTRDPNATNPETVDVLGSIADLNNVGGWPTTGIPGVAGRRYFIDGDELLVLPASQAAGDYLLRYTPQTPALVLPTSIARTPYTRNLVIDVGVDTLIVGTSAAWSFTNGAFTAADVGAALVTAGMANLANNGTRPITSVSSPTDIETAAGPLVTELGFSGTVTASVARLSIVAAAKALSVNAAVFDETFVGATITIAGSASNDGQWVVASVQDAHTVILVDAGGALVNEIFGSGVTLTYHLANQVTELPPALVPWALFLKLHASLAIRQSRQQDLGDFPGKLERQRARAVAAAKTRTEGVTQPPVTRRRWGGWLTRGA